MLRVENLSESHVNGVTPWPPQELPESGDDQLTMNLHRRGQRGPTNNAPNRADCRKKRCGMFGVSDYVIDIGPNLDDKTQQTDDDPNDKQDNDDVMSNYDNVVTSGAECEKSDVLSRKKSFKSKRQKRIKREQDVDSCYHSLRRSSSTSSTSSLQASQPISDATSDDYEGRTKLKPQTIEKILHTKQRIRHMLQPPQVNDEEPERVKVKRKSSSVNKTLRMSKRPDSHYVNISFHKNRNGIRKSSILPPRGGVHLYENVFLPSAKAISQQPDNAQPDFSRSDSGCFLDSDDAIRNLKTEEEDLNATNENDEKVANADWSLWATLKRNARRKSSSLKQNRHTTIGPPLYSPTACETPNEIQSPKEIPQHVEKSDSAFKGCFTSSVDSLPYDDLRACPETQKSSPSPSRVFSLLRSRSKRSPSKKKSVRRKSLPTKISLDVDGGNLYDPSTPQWSQSSTKSKSDKIECMVMTSLQSNVSSSSKSEVGCEDTGSPDEGSRRIKSRFFSSFIRKKSDYGEGKSSPRKQTTRNAAQEERRMSKVLSRSSPQLSSCLIDPNEKPKSRVRL